MNRSETPSQNVYGISIPTCGRIAELLAACIVAGLGTRLFESSSIQVTLGILSAILFLRAVYEIRRDLKLRRNNQ